MARTIHGNAADYIFTEMLLRMVNVRMSAGVLGTGCTYRDLEHKLLAVVFRLEGVQDRRQLGGVELDCGTVSNG